MEREDRNLTPAGKGLQLALECLEVDLALKWLQKRYHDKGPSMVLLQRHPVTYDIVVKMTEHGLIFPYHELAGNDLSGHLLTPLGDTVCRISYHMSKQVTDHTERAFRNTWVLNPNLPLFLFKHGYPK